MIDVYCLLECDFKFNNLLRSGKTKFQLKIKPLNYVKNYSWDKKYIIQEKKRNQKCSFDIVLLHVSSFYNEPNNDLIPGRQWNWNERGSFLPFWKILCEMKLVSFEKSQKKESLLFSVMSEIV